MKEPAAKPRLTRRRVVVVAVMLVLALAVAGVGFKVFDGTGTPRLRISVMLVEPPPGQNITTAIITVSNTSPTRSWGVLVATDDYDFVGRPPCLRPDEYINWRPQMVFTGPGPQIFALAPLSTERGTVVLPADGRVRKVAVYSFAQPRALSRPFNKVREWWWDHVQSWTPKFTLVECDRLIQCPIRLPDGTIEPPRLVREEGPKR